MKIKEFLREKNGSYILEKVLNKDKAWLFLNDNLEVPSEAIDILERINSGYPIEYIFEEVYFYGDRFYIKEGVLIPRDDTEVVVERGIELVRKLGAMRVVDCCTGSGVIAIEIAKHTDAKVLATDISDVAIEVARKNIMLNNVEEKVKVIKGNLLKFQNSKEIKNFGFEVKNNIIKGDILISNPPYVENSWNKPNEYEPDIAFFGGEDGLDIVRELIKEAKKAAYKGAIIEIGYNQKDILSKFLKDKVKEFEFFKDLGGRIRGVEVLF
ncbi:MAG: HemK/PrmC family methyltransferase [Nautiliaceae bacterium]